jgi:hypothetical protein
MFAASCGASGESAPHKKYQQLVPRETGQQTTGPVEKVQSFLVWQLVGGRD